MAHRKAGGSAKNLQDSNPKYLGTKLADGQEAKIGSIIIRQRGTKIMAGKNVGIGKDHTLFALKEGFVTFSMTRKKHFDGKIILKKIISVLEEKKMGKKKPIKISTKKPDSKKTTIKKTINVKKLSAKKST